MLKWFAVTEGGCEEKLLARVVRTHSCSSSTEMRPHILPFIFSLRRDLASLIDTEVANIKLLISASVFKV